MYQCKNYSVLEMNMDGKENSELLVTFAATDSTSLNSEFFNEKLDFGRDPAEEESWYRTTSGRAATVILEAEDEEETIGVLQFSNGESEVRRSQSFRPCLFGPVSSDAEDFESDIETDTETESETETDDEAETSEDIVGDLPDIEYPDMRRNRGCSWYKMNSLGELFQRNGSPNEVKTQKAVRMDAFGNFVICDTKEEQSDPHLEHIKAVQKRHPQTREVKRTAHSNTRPLRSRFVSLFKK